VVAGFCGAAPQSVRRFAMGLAHWVYDVRLADGARLVVRLTTPEQRTAFAGAVHWSHALRPLGVPLPAMLAHGESEGLPYLVLERLDGDDLGVVYSELTSNQRKTLAIEISRVQRLVTALPEGAGYGVVGVPAGPYLRTWRAVLDATLGESRARIAAAGLVSLDVVERVQQRAARFDRYFARVRPVPFLDDITTKNVIVHRGSLSGIVDVDEICFGDPLFTIGQTRAILLKSSLEADYTDHWCDALNLTPEERSVVAFYAAVFCVVFMSEFGHRFNREVTQPDETELAHLERLLDDHLT
jgi:hypothetical protein